MTAERYEGVIKACDELIEEMKEEKREIFSRDAIGIVETPYSSLKLRREKEETDAGA